MNKRFYKRLSKLILEADEEEVNDNEPTDDANDKTDGDGGKEPKNDEGGETELTEEDLDDQTNDYQMDDSDFDENGGEGNDEDGDEVDDTTSDESTEDDVTSSGSENNDAVKKYKLASQFKELLLIIGNLEKSINTIKNTTSDPEMIHYIYIIKQKVENLKSKINFFIVNNFITKPYEELLSSFLFLKKELELIISLIEKVLDEE